MKTIDIQAKEWWDRANGNSYFSARLTVDYGMETEQTFYIPFQYGYGDTYQHAAFKTLQRNRLVPQLTKSPWRYYDEAGIVVRYNKEEGCLKKEVNNWGACCK